MPAVIAPPVSQVTPAVASGIALNPWFDQPAPIIGVLGIPWWFVICCGGALFLILVILSWTFKLRRMAPVKGYKEIQKKAGLDDEMVWLFTKTQKTIIECLRMMDGIASYENMQRIPKWHLPSPMAMAHFGGYPAMMVSDDYFQGRDPVSEVALCHACDEYNRDQDFIKEQNGTPSPYITSFDDYSDFGHDALLRKYPDGIPIPAYNIFNPVRFRKYFPPGASSAFYGGVLIRRAKELKDQVKEQGMLEKYLPLAIVFAIVLVVIMAGWMAPVGK